ncbi:MAG: TauD/TfdA family dioxygenase [Novosphingobium sp.]|nr:TauD/TfdA family dioxygenase [Novosphingobium sp.]
MEPIAGSLSHGPLASGFRSSGNRRTRALCQPHLVNRHCRLGGARGQGLLHLAGLADEFLRPEYQCRWQWSKGDVAIWDNRLVQHYGVPDHTTDRYLERITVSGGPVISIAEWEAQQRSATAPA